jgi:hypothetical protein
MIKYPQIWFFCLLRKLLYEEEDDVSVLERASYERWVRSETTNLEQVALNKASVDILIMDGEADISFKECEKKVEKRLKNELKKYHNWDCVNMDFFEFLGVWDGDDFQR